MKAAVQKIDHSQQRHLALFDGPCVSRAEVLLRYLETLSARHSEVKSL